MTPEPSASPCAPSPLTPARSRAYDLRSRVISALVMVPVALLCLVAGEIPFAVFVAAGAVLVLREWVRMVNGAQRMAPVIVACLFVLAAMGTALTGHPHLAFGIIGGGALVVAGMSSGQRWWTAAGVVYGGLPAVALVHLRGLEDGLLAVGFLLTIIWATDVGAYAGGRAIGGPKLWPAVSPKKTWAGFVSGLLAASLCGVVICMAVAEGSFFSVSVGLAVAIAIVLSIAGQGGDLFESFMKRHFGVKDSGTMIPGHGGAMDRLDSVITSSSAASLLAIASSAPVAVAAVFGGFV